MQALVRKLLLKVHPDVVGSISDKYRLHNENALKSLMSYLDQATEGVNSGSNSGSSRVFFYLRDGGRTSTVMLSSFVPPDRAVRELLGLAINDTDGKPSRPNNGSKPSSAQAAESDELLASPWTKDDFARMFRESMRAWWVQRDFLTNEIERLFIQNRVKYAPDARDITEAPEDDIDPRKAAGVAKETLEYYVEDSTLQALHSPFCNRIELVIVGQNLHEPMRSDDGHTLFVPLNIEPEHFGREIDALIDDIVEQAIHAETQRARAASGV